MTKEQLLKELQQSWNENTEKWITKRFWMNVITIRVQDNCDELTTIDEDENEIRCVDWVLNHFDWNI